MKHVIAARKAPCVTTHPAGPSLKIPTPAHPERSRGVHEKMEFLHRSSRVNRAKRDLYRGMQAIIYFISLICFLSIGTLQAQVNLITAINVDGTKLHVKVNEEFKRKYLKSDFFAEYEPDIKLSSFDYSILSMPFVMNVVSIVWISGDTYYVDEMDAELVESLERVKKVFKTMYPKTAWNGKLIARKLIRHTKPAVNTQERTALLYSGGIDSTSTAFGHLDKKQLLITAWGHWDLPLNEPALWQVRKNKIVAFADQFGNETSFVRSNYSSFLNWEYLSSLTPEIKKWRLGAVEGLGWAGLTAPILLSKGYDILRIASSHTWNYPYPSAASPFVDNNLHYAGLKVVHDQFDMTRLMKIEYLCTAYKQFAKEPAHDKASIFEKPFLKICSVEKKFDANCGACRKCITTAVGFAALNESPRRYGIPLSFADTAKKARELVTPEKLNYYTILFFKEVQAKINERRAQQKPVPQELLSLLTIDFDKKVPYDVLSQHKLDWNVMMSLIDKKDLP